MTPQDLTKRLETIYNLLMKASDRQEMKEINLALKEVFDIQHDLSEAINDTTRSK